MPAEDGPRLAIFLSSTYEDRPLRDRLHKHLIGLQRAGIISVWYLYPGNTWQNVADERLWQADMVLFCITASFIASSLYDTQLKQALELHETGKACVIPVLLRPVLWHEHLPLTKLQGLPLCEQGGLKAVTEWSNTDQAYVAIAEGIRRVAEELIGASSAHHTLSTDERFTLWHVPHRRNPFFTGHNELLSSLYEAFAAHQHPSNIQAISGTAGIGKTQIAIEYAYQYREQYRAIFWLKGDSSEDFFNDFLYLARLLQLPERKESDQSIVISAIKRHLSRTPGWLLIIDNLTNLALLDELIELEGRGDILVTTRGQVGRARALPRQIEEMSLDEGASFLLRRSGVVEQLGGGAVPPTLLEQARQICQLLDGLPLALDQAGAYIEEAHVSLPDYITRYNKHAAKLLKQRGTFAPGHPQSVAATFSLCLEKAQQDNPAALDLLRLCAFFHPAAIPIELIVAATPNCGKLLQPVIADEMEIDAVLKTLTDLALLQRNPTTETLSMLRVVQVVLRDEMDEGTQRLWAERAIQALSRVFPIPQPELWPQCQQYLPHAQVAAHLIRQWYFVFPEAAQLLYRAARYLCDRAHYNEARLLAEQALAIDEQAMGSEHPDTARTLHLLGDIDHGHGNHQQAQYWYERALAIGEHAWGPQHLDTARTLNQLGELAQTRGQFAQAEHYYRRALNIRQKFFEREPLEIAASLNNVGGIREEQGDYAQAEQLYHEALRVREGLRGPSHPATAESLSNIARFYRVTGRYREALPLYERSIAACESAFGPEHPGFATSLNNFGFFCIVLGRYAQAEELLNHAIQIRKLVFGDEHSITAASKGHLARVYSKQGRYEQAEALYEQALAICEHELGRTHPRTTVLLTNLGEHYLACGIYDKAESLFKEVLETITQRLDMRHPDRASVLNLLGNLYLTQADYDRAEPLLTAALAIRKEMLGNAHPETGMSLKSLADLAFARNDEGQAELLYRQALDAVLVPLGADHPDVVELVEHYTRLLRRMGRQDEAQALLQRIRGTPQ